MVERTQAWLRGFHRLQVRYEQSANLLISSLHLAYALTYARTLNPS